MSVISLIAAVDERCGLGKDNALLCHLPADLKHFKALTLGKPIIMGRKTYQSIGKPLPGRKNIVISRQCLVYEGVDVVPSLADALLLVRTVPEVMIIGGAQVFKDAMPLAQRLYLTRIGHQFDADVFFPAINPADWACCGVEILQPDDKNNYMITFLEYVRK